MWQKHGGPLELTEPVGHAFSQIDYSTEMIRFFDFVMGTSI